MRRGESHEVWNCTLKLVFPSKRLYFSPFLLSSQTSLLVFRKSLECETPFLFQCLDVSQCHWCWTRSYSVGMIDKSLIGTIFEIWLYFIETQLCILLGHEHLLAFVPDVFKDGMLTCEDKWSSWRPSHIHRILSSHLVFSRLCRQNADLYGEILLLQTNC